MQDSSENKLYLLSGEEPNSALVPPSVIKDVKVVATCAPPYGEWLGSPFTGCAMFSLRNLNKTLQCHSSKMLLLVL